MKLSFFSIKKLVPALLILVCMSSLLQVHAQSKLSIDKIAVINLRNSGPIISDEEIKGYFLFYQTDKVDRGTNEYALQILDDNLNKVKTIEFQDSKDLVLLESAFNGNDIMFMFSNDKTLEYRVYGIDGVEKVRFDYPINAKTRDFIGRIRAMSSDESQNKNLFGIDKKAFITVVQTRQGNGTSFEIQGFQTSPKKQWSYQPSSGNLQGSGAQYLGTTDRVALFSVMRIENLFTSQLTNSILGLDIGTGEVRFEIETFRDKYNFFPVNVATLPNSKEFMVMGLYFDKKDKLFDKNLGLGIWVMDESGNKLVTKYNSWDDDMDKQFKASKINRDALGDIFFHDIINTQDEKIFAIGEGYRFVKNSVRVTNMVLLEFDRSFNITAAHVYPKNENKINIPMLLNSSFLSAGMVKSAGGFDYNFLQTNKQHSLFTFTFTDLERSKKKVNPLTFNTVSYYNNAFSTDKIQLKSESSVTRILPSKTGTVMIMEYFKKEKRLDMRMEKIN